MSAKNVSSLARIRSSGPSAGPTAIVASRSNRGRGSHSGLHVANTNKQCQRYFPQHLLQGHFGIVQVKHLKGIFFIGCIYCLANKVSCKNNQTDTNGV